MDLHQAAHDVSGLAPDVHRLHTTLTDALPDTTPRDRATSPPIAGVLERRERFT